jgi:hypothetical protein
VKAEAARSAGCAHYIGSGQPFTNATKPTAALQSLWATAFLQSNPNDVKFKSTLRI